MVTTVVFGETAPGVFRDTLESVLHIPTSPAEPTPTRPRGDASKRPRPQPATVIDAPAVAATFVRTGALGEFVSNVTDVDQVTDRSSPMVTRTICCVQLPVHARVTPGDLLRILESPTHRVFCTAEPPSRLTPDTADCARPRLVPSIVRLRDPEDAVLLRTVLLMTGRQYESCRVWEPRSMLEANVVTIAKRFEIPIHIFTVTAECATHLVTSTPELPKREVLE